MSVKITPTKWARNKMTKDEKYFVVMTWNELVDERKVKINGEQEIHNNFQILCSRLQLTDDGFRKGIAEGMPSNSKKYKQLHYLVTKYTNPKPSSPVKPNTPKGKGPTFSQEDEMKLFGQESPEVHHSGFTSSFFSTPDHNMTNDLTIIEETCPEDKKENDTTMHDIHQMLSQRSSSVQ